MGFLQDGWFWAAVGAVASLITLVEFFGGKTWLHRKLFGRDRQVESLLPADTGRSRDSLVSEAVRGGLAGGAAAAVLGQVLAGHDLPADIPDADLPDAPADLPDDLPDFGG